MRESVACLLPLMTIFHNSDVEAIIYTWQQMFNIQERELLLVRVLSEQPPEAREDAAKELALPMPIVKDETCDEIVRLYFREPNRGTDPLKKIAFTDNPHSILQNPLSNCFFCYKKKALQEIYSSQNLCLSTL